MLNFGSQTPGLYRPTGASSASAANPGIHNQVRGGLHSMGATTSINTPQFAGNGNNKITKEIVVASVDHTKLTFKPGEDETASIRKLCQEAVDSWRSPENAATSPQGFYAVCVRPRHIQLAKTETTNSPVKVATVIGFPLDKIELAAEKQSPTVGNFSTADKVAETRQAIANGANEIDLVLNVALFKQEAHGAQLTQTLNELVAVNEAAQGRPVKVIIETDLLSDEEIAKASRACHEAKVAMVKTSTGMVNGGVGATVSGLEIISKTLDSLNSTLEIKASGGVKNLAQALKVRSVKRVTRIGTSSGVDIIKEQTSKADY